MIYSPSLFRRQGFTLVELLTVMAVIGILAALTLQVSGFVQKKAAMSRAESEIRAMEAACEGYKSDNGVYPETTVTDSLDPRTTGTPTAAASLVLYRALSGDMDLNGTVDSSDSSKGIDGSSSTALGSGTPKSYMQFKPDMLGRATLNKPVSASNAVTFLSDPWGNSYGYSTAAAAQAQTSTTQKGYNPTFDLWSTTGKTTTPAPGTATDVTIQWIKNW